MHRSAGQGFDKLSPNGFVIRKIFLFLALLFTPALAQARAIEPQLVAEGPAPPGGEVELAIQMRTRPGWHGYWLNPGDAGLPMAVQWQVPAGFSAGPLRYPVPTRLTVAGLMNYVYERDYAVLVRFNVPAGAKDANGLPLNYIKGAAFGTANGPASYPRPRPGLDGGRAFLASFGVRF